jgi:hypothetical protein
MRAHVVLAVLLCLILLSAVGLSAAAHEYQAGKIVKVEKHASHTPSGGTDAPSQAKVATYDISIQIGDKVYVCRYQADPELVSWVEGKDVQARVSGRVMYVKKANGKEAKGSIVSTAPAGNP